MPADPRLFWREALPVGREKLPNYAWAFLVLFPAPELVPRSGFNEMAPNPRLEWGQPLRRSSRSAVQAHAPWQGGQQ
eukprot:1372466-Pyramimonas_sp.AAC.1